MKFYFKRKLDELLSRLSNKNNLDKSFIFPYSEDREIRKQQIWSNLQKGILLEDTKEFIPWLTPFNRLHKYRKERRDSGDRTNWYLGKHSILNGYECHIEAMKYMNWPWGNPICEVSENIGYDMEGMKNFHYLGKYISELLGLPTNVDLEKFGSFDLGTVEWINGDIQISLVGVEIFNCRYSLHIGLAMNYNRQYEEKAFKKLKEKLLKRGFTEEDFGK